jgi:hypothetical protein
MRATLILGASLGICSALTNEIWCSFLAGLPMQGERARESAGRMVRLAAAALVGLQPFFALCPFVTQWSKTKSLSLQVSRIFYTCIRTGTAHKRTNSAICSSPASINRYRYEALS